MYFMIKKSLKMYYVRKRTKRHTPECLQWLFMHTLQNFYSICIFWHFSSFLLSAYITFAISKIINNYTHREECAESLKKRMIILKSSTSLCVYELSYICRNILPFNFKIIFLLYSSSVPRSVVS